MLSGAFIHGNSQDLQNVVTNGAATSEKPLSLDQATRRRLEESGAI